MAIDAGNHPEFPDSVHTLILDAVLVLMQQDSSLAGYLGPNINQIESREIRQLGSKATPSIWGYLFSDEETALPSGRAFVETTVSIILLDKYGRYRDGDRQSLSRRVLAYVQTLIHKEIVLKDPGGNQITDSVIRYNRVPAKEVIDSAVFAVELQAVFGSTIDQLTQLSD